MSQQPVALLTRKETFSACHRLHSKHLSDAENAEIYGKCNNPNGHGHNYTGFTTKLYLKHGAVPTVRKVVGEKDGRHKQREQRMQKRENKKIVQQLIKEHDAASALLTVEVTVRGPIDIRTGMIMNITDLKAAMDGVIFKQLDHKNLDKDVEYFHNVPSTTENLTVFIWDHVHDALKRPELLFEVKIHETDKNSVTYRGPHMQNGQYYGYRRSPKTSCNNISSDSD